MEYRGAIVDLDGTVYRGDSLVPGSRAAIERLRDRGLDLLFVTNNPTRTREAYVERLAGMGLEVSREEVLSAGTVTTEFLAEHHGDDDLFVVGSDGLREQFAAADLVAVDDPDSADVVVTSHDYRFDYDDMTRAVWALDAADTFVGTDPDRTYPGRDDRDYPGSGAITHAVAAAAERDPDRELGKPAPETLDIALDHLGHDPDECFVVGDRANTDVALGESAGMTTVLVLTGTTRRRDLPVSPEPDHVIDALSEIDAVLDGA